MTESAPIPRALDQLHALCRAGTEPRLIHDTLVELQHRGLSQTDLIVHLERWRAVNDVTEDSETMEESCLDALDMVTGWAGFLKLDWPTPAAASPDPSRVPALPQTIFNLERRGPLAQPWRALDRLLAALARQLRIL